MRKIFVTLCFLGLLAVVLSDNAERGLCPNNCSSHGTCSGMTCTCNNGYVGIDCSIASKNVTAGDTESQRLSDHTWAYYVLNVPTGSASVDFKLHQTSNGDCDLFVKYGSYPTRITYDKYDISRDADFDIEFEAPNTGLYYAGVYGFYSCQFQLTFVVQSGQSCPGNCNGHGTCSAGKCVCTSPYQGDDCSQSTIIATVDQVYSASVTEENWIWFKFDAKADPSVNRVLATQFVVNQTSSGDCDMYISFGKEPNLWDFDYRDASFRTDFSITIGEPKVGEYYIGIYGYEPTSFNFKIHQLAPTCPNQCSLHGTCRSNICSCDANFVGTECETMTTVLPYDKAQKGYAGDNNWNYYHITPSTSDNIVVEIVQTSPDADCDLYIRAGSAPTRFDFDFRDISYDANFNVTIENPQLQTWYIGVYGYFGCAYNITVAVERSSCPNACSRHGTCSKAGRCDCDAGFAGEDCGSPLFHLSNGIPRQTNITLNQWQYYKFEVPSVPSSLTVEVAEFNTTGTLWVYVNQGAPPTLSDFDYIDSSHESHFHTIYFKTHGDSEDVNYYIGVYGSPYVPVGANNAVDYGVIAYSPPI